MSNATLRYTTTSDIALLAPEFTSEAGYPPKVIEAYIRRAEVILRSELAYAFPRIANQTSWSSPSKTPEVICDIANEMTVGLLEIKYYSNNGNWEPTVDNYLSTAYNKIYALRGYNRYNKRVAIMPLYNRTGTIIAPASGSPYMDTSTQSDQLSGSTWEGTDFVDGIDPTTDGSLKDYRMPTSRGF